MARYNVEGSWQINQGATIITVNLSPPRPDGVFNGTASYNSVHGAGFGGVEVIYYDEFTFNIRWSNGTQGFYSGTFDNSGFIKGVTFDVTNPSSTATWQSSKAFTRH